MKTTAHSSLRLERSRSHSTKQKHFLFRANMISHLHFPLLKKPLLCFIATWNSSRVCMKSLTRMQTKSWNIWESSKNINLTIKKKCKAALETLSAFKNDVEEVLRYLSLFKNNGITASSFLSKFQNDTTKAKILKDLWTTEKEPMRYWKTSRISMK